MAIAVAASKMFGMQTPEQALTLMLLAQAEGMHPITAARDYDIIQGRPAKKSEAMLRDFMKAGGTVEWHEMNNAKADATFFHPIGGTVRIDWDMPRAIAAELGTKPMWKKYPRQMLRARVISEGVKSVFPLATGGLYAPEEVQDFKTDPKDPRDPPPGKPPTVNVTQEHDVDAAAPAQDQPKGEFHSFAGGSGPITPRDAAEEAGQAGIPADESEPRADLRPVTESQVTRLHTLAAVHKWEPDQVKTYIAQAFGLGSSKSLNRDQYDALIETIETKKYGPAFAAAIARSHKA